MKLIKSWLSSPYLYIFLISYYGVWLSWNHIILPYKDHAGIISYLPSLRINPSNNILRFLMAILIPPLICWLFWVVSNNRFTKIYSGSKRIRYTFKAFILFASLLLCAFMGIVQSSTNPANNPPDTYGGPYKYALIDTFHEGETLAPAISYEQPNLKPYRDFVPIHGVFQDAYRTVIAFRLFGHSIGASRAMASILTILGFGVYFLLLIVIFRGNLFKSALGLVILALLLVPSTTLPTVGQFIFGVQLPFRDIATMLFLMAAIVGLRALFAKRSVLHISMSMSVGFVAVVGFANSLDRAIYIAALSVLWLLMIFIVSPFMSFVKHSLLPYILGCLIGLPLLGLALKWAFKDFLTYVVTISKYKEYLDGMVFQQPDVATSLVLLSVSAGILFGGARLWKALSDQKVKNKKSIFNKASAIKNAMSPLVRQHYIYILLFATATIFLRSAIGRAELSHFVYVVQWLYLFFAVMFIKFFYSRLNKNNFASFVTILLLSVMFVSYGGRVKSIDIAHDTFPINLKDSEIVRPDYLQTADFLKQNLHGQETFVTLTSEGTWYYLADKPSPIRYFVIWYAFTATQRNEIADQLDSNSNIKYIVTNNNWTSNFDYVPNPQRFPEVYKVLNNRYVPTVGFGQQTVWIRK